MFKGLKSDGFNIEDTHMVHINRIRQVLRDCHYRLHIGLSCLYCRDLKVKAIKNTQQ